MKGHLGAILTSVLSAVALALAVLQAAVVFVHARPVAQVSPAAAQAGPSRRFSTPGGRSGIPYQWNAEPPPRTLPGTREKRDEPRHTPPRSRGGIPEAGPHPQRRLAA